MTVRSLLLFRYVEGYWGQSWSSLQVEENSVTPWEGEVESGTTEERTNDDEYCPEHEEQSEH
jgi:hypothetical protein